MMARNGAIVSHPDNAWRVADRFEGYKGVGMNAEKPPFDEMFGAADTC